MAKNVISPPPRNTGGAGSGLGKSLIVITLVCILGLVGYKFLTKDKDYSMLDTMQPDYTAIPEEMHIKYVPKDFKYDLDDDNSLAVLSNPRRYRREFNELVYNFNMAMLSHVSERMNLPDSLNNRLESEYRKHHSYLKELYYNDFLALQDTSASTYEMWYNNESTSAVDVMNEVSSKYACFLVNHVISTLVTTDNGKIYGKGRQVDDPCLIATTEALRPMMGRLQERAAVVDFSKSRGMMEEKVEKVIAELGTMEIRDKKGINKQLQTKIWGYSVSSTDIEVSAISILKIGFKLDKYFKVDVNSRNKQVVVTLPDPEILSHEVYPKVDKLDVGWMREIDNSDLNKNFNVLRREFRKDAKDSDVFDKSKVQAEELMNVMLGPLVNQIGKGYQLTIKYHPIEPDIPIDMEISNQNQEERPDGKRISTSDVPY